MVRKFSEKPQTGEGWINGGFFCLRAWCLRLHYRRQTSLEREPLERLAADQINGISSPRILEPMDTLREKHLLNSLWESGEAPWKNWE